jgi:hypothetical protein
MLQKYPGVLAPSQQQRSSDTRGIRQGGLTYTARSFERLRACRSRRSCCSANDAKGKHESSDMGQVGVVAADAFDRHKVSRVLKIDRRSPFGRQGAVGVALDSSPQSGVSGRS